MANGDVQLLTLDKQTFDEYMGIMIEKQQERLVFFQTCFPTMSKRTIQNFHCMFQKITRRRGDILHKKGDPASHLYLIEDGEIAIVNPNKLNGLSRVQINKLEVVVIIDKYALVGDELLLSNNYMFSAVCTGQPTRLYVLERSKLFGAEAILGKELMADLRAQMRVAGV